jgi:hypothetical protein
MLVSTHAIGERFVTSRRLQSQAMQFGMRDKLNQESPNALGNPGQVGDPLAPPLRKMGK